MGKKSKQCCPLFVLNKFHKSKSLKKILLKKIPTIMTIPTEDGPVFTVSIHCLGACVEPSLPCRSKQKRM